MAILPDSIVVDGREYRARFAGWGEPLTAMVPGGGTVTLRPWRWQAHVDAMRASLSVEDEGVQFDGPGFARRVLADSGVTGATAEALIPLGLWWGAGGADPASTAPRPTPWTEAQRNHALGASMAATPSGAPQFAPPAFDIVGYVEAMVDASEDDPGYWECDRFVPLLEALAVTNVLDPQAERQRLIGDGADVPRRAQRLLALCRALGWTPSQVEQAPAVEMDRLALLLEWITADAPPAPPLRGLAGAPDAVVIQIED